MGLGALDALLAGSSPRRATYFSVSRQEGVEKTNYTKRLSNMRACASQTHAVA